jgi:hypothetical protein
MGKIYATIDDTLGAFIASQHVFFVATAPVGEAGHVNLSPKGLDTFRILGPTTIAYLDFVGSGAETIAHLRENGRIVVMLCAFDGPPKIVRLYGRGTVAEPGDPEFAALREQFSPARAVRSVIRVELDRITDSCGYGVPRYCYEGPRTQLNEWATRKGDDGVRAYQSEHNVHSIDGLPALRWVERE